MIINKPTFDLEGLCRLQEGRELVLHDVYFAPVHVVDKSPQLGERDILEEYDGVLLRLLAQKTLQQTKKQTGTLDTNGKSPIRNTKYLKVITAGTKNDAVSFNKLAFRRQHDIDASLVLHQQIKRRNDSAVVIIPTQTKLISHFWRMK